MCSLEALHYSLVWLHTASVLISRSMTLRNDHITPFSHSVFTAPPPPPFSPPPRCRHHNSGHMWNRACHHAACPLSWLVPLIDSIDWRAKFKSSRGADFWQVDLTNPSLLESEGVTLHQPLTKTNRFQVGGDMGGGWVGGRNSFMCDAIKCATLGL